MGVMLKDKVKIGVENENDCLLRKKNDEEEDLKEFFGSEFCALHTLGCHVVNHG